MDENCTIVNQVTDLQPTALRLNRVYIIAYVNWVWTITTVVLPFATLVILSLRIYFGLRRVNMNLNRYVSIATLLTLTTEHRGRWH
jgi:hypothetical protein